MSTAVAVQEMVEAGNAVIAEIEQDIANLDARVAEAHAEREALHQAQEERVHALQDARIAWERAEADYNQAVAYGKLAHAKPNEKEAIKAVSAAKKALQAAKKEYDRLEQENAEALQQAILREKELTNQVHMLEFEKETRHAEIKSVQSGRNKAHAELGIHIHTEMKEGHEEKQKCVDDLQAQLVEAQVQLHDFHAEALQELAEWPALQKDIANLIPPDDALIRVCVATLQHIETLLEDGQNGYPDMQLPWDLRDVLFIREQSLRHAGSLHDHKHRLHQVLDAYCAWLAER